MTRKEFFLRKLKVKRDTKTDYPKEILTFNIIETYYLNGKWDKEELLRFSSKDKQEQYFKELIAIYNNEQGIEFVTNTKDIWVYKDDLYEYQITKEYSTVVIN